tara:strand:- start:1954 stop:2232 length:279 start_codon:yes stop_codon:yes gene_type:complete
MNEWELKIRKKNFRKRMKMLMRNSLKYCVIESYKIYTETVKGQSDIKYLRETLKTLYEKNQHLYDNEFTYEEEDILKEELIKKLDKFKSFII